MVVELAKRSSLGATSSSGDVAGELHAVVDVETSIGESAMSVSLSTGSRNVEKAWLKPDLVDDFVRGGVWSASVAVGKTRGATSEVGLGFLV